MGKGKAALYTLQVLARDLITHDVTFLSVVKLLSRTSLVNTNHGYADGPCRLSDAESKIAVIRIDVSALLEGLDYLHDWF